MELVKEKIIVKRGPGRPRKILAEIKQEDKPLIKKMVSIEIPEVIAEIKLPVVKDYSKLLTFNVSSGYINILNKSICGKYDVNLGTIYPSPTNNCQMWSLASAANVIMKPKEDALAIFKEIWNKVQKNILMVDIATIYLSKAKDLFGDNIITETPYKSTNGSQMVILLINTKNILRKT